MPTVAATKTIAANILRIVSSPKSKSLIAVFGFNPARAVRLCLRSYTYGFSPADRPIVATLAGEFFIIIFEGN